MENGPYTKLRQFRLYFTGSREPLNNFKRGRGMIKGRETTREVTTVV